MKYVAIILLLLIGYVVVHKSQGSESYMYSRNLGCDAYGPRAQDICRSFGREMEWSWLGHAVISPGWRTTFEGMRRVYCKNHIALKDVPALKEMAGYKPFKTTDWRLEQGVVGLLTLLRAGGEAKAAGIPDGEFDVRSGESFSTGSDSVFNEQNPAYILRNGCAGIAGTAP